MLAAVRSIALITGGMNQTIIADDLNTILSMDQLRYLHGSMGTHARRRPACGHLQSMLQTHCAARMFRYV